MMRYLRNAAPAAVVALAAVALAAVALGAAGCSRSASTAAQPPTARLERVAGTGVPSIVLTPLGASRIAVETAEATRAKADTVVPYAALVYESNGSTAVYVNTGRLTYTRYIVPVDYITGDQVYLKGAGGLPADARVVTQGAEELLGVQNGVGEET
jgi:hypothetical protein